MVFILKNWITLSNYLSLKMIALKGFQLYFSTFLNTSWTLYDPVHLLLYQRKKGATAAHFNQNNN